VRVRVQRYVPRTHSRAPIQRVHILPGMSLQPSLFHLDPRHHHHCHVLGEY
jgi:hypothetical protein